MSRMIDLEPIADPNRRRILDLLRDGERPAGDFVRALTISQPGVSRHLRILREAGLVTVREDGQRRLYSLRPQPLKALDQWLQPYRRFWGARLDALEHHLNEEQ